MKTIYLAMPPYLPVPAVKGGAVETLAELFMDENEKQHRFDLVCFSVDCPEAREKAKQYRYTKFVFCNVQTRSCKARYAVSRPVHKVTRQRPYCLDDFHGGIYRAVKQCKPDLLIVEGGSCIDEYKKIAAWLGADRMALHVHTNTVNSCAANRVFGHLICVSEFTRREWQNKVAIADCHVLQNATRIARYDPADLQLAQSAAALREKLGYRPEDFVLLFCGRLTEVKGVRELIRAVLAIENDRIRLLVLGSANFSGADRTAYQKELLALVGRTDRVKFTGFIPNAATPAYYALAQAVVVPSLYEDPAPLVAIEGMAAGKAMIVTESGGMAEYVPAEGRILVRKEPEWIVEDLKRAIETLYPNGHSEALCKAMGEKNLAASKAYSEAAYYTRYSEIIEAICEGRRD
jgi:glycosyltransferase involved in cell wall biosynthesis